MRWETVRQLHPHQWLLVEVLKSRSEGEKRIIEDLAVVDTFPDSRTALASFARVRRDLPGKDVFVIHTDCEALDLKKRRWLGFRSGQ